MFPRWLKKRQRQGRVGRPAATVLRHLRRTNVRLLREDGRLFVFGYQVAPWPEDTWTSNDRTTQVTQALLLWDRDRGDAFLTQVRQVMSERGCIRDGGPDVVASYDYDHERRRHPEYHVARAYWDVIHTISSNPDYRSCLPTSAVIGAFLAENLSNTIKNIGRHEENRRHKARWHDAQNAPPSDSPEDVLGEEDVKIGKAIAAFAIAGCRIEDLKKRFPHRREDQLKRALQNLRIALQLDQEEVNGD